MEATKTAKNGKNKNAAQTAKTQKGTRTQNLNQINLQKAAHDGQVGHGNSDDGRDPKYNYPADCTTADQKKLFRRNARATADRYEKTLAKLRKSNDAADQKELIRLEKEVKTWLKGTYTHPEELVNQN